MSYWILFLFFIIIISLNVIFQSNPIHAMLHLILLFINVCGILFYLGLDYLALMLLIVYVGAINVLFLFIIMMLNIKIIVSKFNFFKFIPIGGLFIIIFFYLIYIKFDFNFSIINEFDSNTINWLELIKVKTNIQYIGEELINNYLSLLIISGLILLLAMISAIILTFKKNNVNKKQTIITQLKRNGVLWLYKQK
uniref:NADH-ubiquinone oxidoreductase chain 6 n=1 Tax=Gefionella okellyi TaxID=2853422 RepID=A0A0B5GWD5_9EUKA|nr:NADH dehydrogenase subunit 6 [Gefionella okellyi]